MTRNLCIVLGDQLSQNITSLKNLTQICQKISGNKIKFPVETESK